MGLESAVRAAQGLLIGVGSLVLAFPACAHLGGPYASVEADSVRLGAALQSTATATHSVHALTLANHGQIKEFTGAGAGAVFAVTWRGAGRPDLRSLLGEHFQKLQADNVRPGPRSRRPLSVHRSDLVIVTGGHPGGFWGVAFLPQQIPADFPSGELRN